MESHGAWNGHSSSCQKRYAGLFVDVSGLCSIVENQDMDAELVERFIGIILNNY